MAKMTNVRTILVIVASELWQIQKLDVKNVFLHGDLKEKVYIKFPSGIPLLPNIICKLKYYLYGLKHAPRVLFENFRTTLVGFSFLQRS